jgi:hypothetical protein
LLTIADGEADTHPEIVPDTLTEAVDDPEGLAKPLQDLAPDSETTTEAEAASLKLRT